MAKIFNPGTVYIPNSAPEAERPRMTGFGADMDTGRVTSYGQDAYGNLTDRTRYYGNADSDAMRMGYSQLMDAAETESRAAQRRRRTALTAMVGAAQKNGGLVPKPIMRQAAQDLGIPNAVGGVLTPEGNFALLGNNNGQIAPLGIVNPRMVMDAALDTGDADLADSFAKELGKHYTPDQLAAWGYTPQKTKAMRAQRAAAANEANLQKSKADALKVLAEIDKGNRPATFEDFIRALPKEVISGMSRGELEVDPEGNPVMDAEGNPLYKQATPAEIGQRLREIYDGSRGGGSQDDGGGELRNAIIGAVRGMFAPQLMDPRDAAMYDNAKQQEYIRSNPQSAFEIKGADGRSRYMNGWIVDGRLYDGRGNDVTDSLADGESVSDLTSGATYDFSTPAQPSQQPTREEIQAELARRRAAKEQQQQPTGLPQSAELSQLAAAPESPAPAQGQQDSRSDGAMPSPSEELREKNTSRGAKAERESATFEDLWGSDVMDRFRRNHPEATDEDIRSGKFDRVLEKIGSALHGDDYKSGNLSLKEKESRLRAAEERAKYAKDQEDLRQAGIAKMTKQERAIAQKAQDLFGDAWKQADDWAIEHHGEGVFFKDSYEAARAKKFAELVKEKAKKDKIQLYNIYKPGQNVFGNYDIGNVFDTVFGAGAGTYFGRPRDGALLRLEQLRPERKQS